LWVLGFEWEDCCTSTHNLRLVSLSPPRLRGSTFPSARWQVGKLTARMQDVTPAFQPRFSGRGECPFRSAAHPPARACRVGIGPRNPFACNFRGSRHGAMRRASRTGQRHSPGAILSPRGGPLLLARPGPLLRARYHHDNVALAEAPSYGQTIFEYRPDCRGAKDYLALSQEAVARR
jgi:hypothetical protein